MSWYITHLDAGGCRGEGGSAHLSLLLLSLGHRALGRTQTCSPLPNRISGVSAKEGGKKKRWQNDAPQGHLATALKWPSKAPTCNPAPARPCAEQHGGGADTETARSAWHHPEVHPANPTQEQSELVSLDAGTAVRPSYPHCPWPHAD